MPGVRVGDSGLCCTCVTYFERLLTPLLVDSSPKGLRESYFVRQLGDAVEADYKLHQTGSSKYDVIGSSANCRDKSRRAQNGHETGITEDEIQRCIYLFLNI